MVCFSRYAALMVDTDDQSWLRALQLLEDSERRGVAANDVMFGKACMGPATPKRGKMHGPWGGFSMDSHYTYNCRSVS